MGQLSLSQGRLFGACYEAMLYGINLVLLIIMMTLFARQKGVSRVQSIRAASICIIFAICTVHLAIVFRGLQIAFFESPSSDAFFNDRAQPVDLVQKASYSVATVLADGLLIHRLYVIFAGNWKAIILPCMSLLATSVTWFLLVNAYRHSPSGTTLYAHTIIRFAPTAFILSFFTNVLITVMILVRTVLTMRGVREFAATQRFNRRFVAYTVESGLVYPLALLATGILFHIKNNGIEILSGSNIQLLCLVPLMLALQMRLNLSIYCRRMHPRSLSFLRSISFLLALLNPVVTETRTYAHADVAHPQSFTHEPTD
ncbi:hypothetical protein B0H21DRAFT_500316 [Amylocystis lapponica]|nr:hypothetical protein B0H21DRAFT_500316 [Amylocystis lapponica]